MNDVAALVPMRHASERIPGKNYRDLAGKPLYAHILDTLHRVPEISIILVDTDSAIIRDGAATCSNKVVVIERPEHLRGGDVPMNEIIAHDLGFTTCLEILQTHSTNPFLSVDTI